MKKMKSIIATSYGGPEVLKLSEVEIPSLKSNEVLIKISTTSITAASTFMRKGLPYFGRLFTGLTKPKIKTPGTDLAGVIAAVGKAVKKFKVGDRVMAETGLNCGAYAEYICLNANDLIVFQPEGISAEEATGILDGACTALAFFTDQVKINKGDKVLINGASGSIGTAAIQLAKYFGAEVSGLTSTKNMALVKDIGADKVLDYTKDELAFSKKKYDVIFDTVGKLSFFKAKKHLTKNGVFLTPVLSFSTILTMLFITPFSKKKLKFAATGLRKPELRRRDLDLVKYMLEMKILTTVIDRVYPLDQIQAAHKYVDTGHKRGNVILKIN